MKEAKYTEYLADYLKTHNLPVEFELIDGFDDLFTATYADREIGFETEELFEIKLSAKAAIVIPIYKARIDHLTSAWEDVAHAEKVVTEATQEAGSDTLNVGSQKSTMTELPLDVETSLPNTEQKSDAYMNSSARNNARNVTRTEGGVSTLEAYDVIERLNKDVYNVLYYLLREFENLFMGVL